MNFSNQSDIDHIATELSRLTLYEIPDALDTLTPENLGKLELYYYRRRMQTMVEFVFAAGLRNCGTDYAYMKF